MGFGSDLSGSWHDLQCTEFAIRAEVLEPIDLLRSATSVGAEIVRMENRLGRVKEGFIADLIAVAGNPLEDIGILDRRAGETLGLIMKDGRIVKNALPSARQSEVRKS
jgi:imidazolonepropionase-like amidohydrolase